MTSLIERALRLWSNPNPVGAAGLHTFGSVYTDPLTVNGQPTPLQTLVDRARMPQAALDWIRSEVHERFEAPGRQAFAFRIHGRHVGPLVTPLGEVAATGREVEIAGQDIFVVDEEADRVTGVWALSDQLGLLVQLGAVEPGAAMGATVPAWPG